MEAVQVGRSLLEIRCRCLIEGRIVLTAALGCRLVDHRSGCFEGKPLAGSFSAVQVEMADCQTGCFEATVLVGWLRSPQTAGRHSGSMGDLAGIQCPQFVAGCRSWCFGGQGHSDQAVHPPDLMEYLGVKSRQCHCLEDFRTEVDPVGRYSVKSRMEAVRVDHCSMASRVVVDQAGCHDQADFRS